MRFAHVGHIDEAFLVHSLRFPGTLALSYNRQFVRNAAITTMKRELTMQRSAMASAILGFSVLASSILAQEKSVRPGVNDSFRDPKISEFQEKFEIESREVFAKRKEIIEVCKVAPGMTVADIGALKPQTRMLASIVINRRNSAHT